jgi:hypothetical protein
LQDLGPFLLFFLPVVLLWHMLPSWCTQAQKQQGQLSLE